MTATRVPRFARRAGALAAGFMLVAALALPALARAGDDDPLNSVSSVDQYVEDLPTASGPTPTGGGPGEGDDPGQPLSADAESAIDQQGGQDAEALKRLATLAALGAPREGLATSPEVRRALAENRSIGAAVGNAASGTTPALFALIVLLVGTSVVLLALALRRARR